MTASYPVVNFTAVNFTTPIATLTYSTLPTPTPEIDGCRF